MAFQFDDQQPLIVRLINGSDAGANQMFAQQHAEHGRLRRVFKAALRQVHPGIPCTRRQQQAQVLPFCAQGQQQHIPFRLLHLVNPAALQFLFQLSRQG